MVLRSVAGCGSAWGATGRTRAMQVDAARHVVLSAILSAAPDLLGDQLQQSALQRPHSSAGSTIVHCFGTLTGNANRRQMWALLGLPHTNGVGILHAEREALSTGIVVNKNKARD